MSEFYALQRLPCKYVFALFNGYDFSLSGYTGIAVTMNNPGSNLNAMIAEMKISFFSITDVTCPNTDYGKMMPSKMYKQCKDYCIFPKLKKWSHNITFSEGSVVQLLILFDNDNYIVTADRNKLIFVWYSLYVKLSYTILHLWIQNSWGAKTAVKVNA